MCHIGTLKLSNLPKLVGMFAGMYNFLRNQDRELNLKAQPSEGEHLHDHESLDMVPSGRVLTLLDERVNIDVDRHATNLFSFIAYHFLTHQGQVDMINSGCALPTIDNNNG
jgi:hypothetical protein